MLNVKVVGIKVLKNRLSHYVRLVKAGETVLVTDRDDVVAELRPPGPGRALQASDAALSQAIRDGLITAATLAPSPPRQVPAVYPLKQVLGGLDGDRSDRGER